LHALSRPNAVAAAFPGTIFTRPFAGSRTVSGFTLALFSCEDLMPWTLGRAIEDELRRSDVALDSDAEERRRAAFLARLTVEALAPFALRRAGYLRMAADVASGTLPPAAAEHTIGREHVGKGIMLRPPASAYSASAHAATAAFYAAHQDIDVVIQTGRYCASALLAPLEPLIEDEVDAAEPTGVWNCAVRTINRAMCLGTIAHLSAEDR
jgi:hypothetical protein